MVSERSNKLTFKRLVSQHVNAKLGRIKAIELATTETFVAILFALSLGLFEGLVLPVSYQRYLDSLRLGEYVTVIGAFSVILATFIWAVLYFRASLTSTYTLRVVYFAIFVLAVCFEYGYQNVYGRFSTEEDLRIALFDATSEQWRGSIRTYFNWLSVLPCLVYATLLFAFKARRKSSGKILALLFLLLLGFYAVVSPYIVGEFSTLSVNAFLRTIATSPFRWGSHYRGPRVNIPLQPDAHPQNNIVLIMDESVRGDHLSVNGYARQTTPYLDQLQQQGWLQTWGIAAAGATCSKNSSDMLLVGMGPADLPDRDYQIWKRPSLFQYAKAMGYRTYFIDGQSKVFWLGTSYDRNYIDDWITPRQFSTNPNERDEAIGKMVAEIVDSSVGNFIWVSKRGVHYPYADKFPASEIRWEPSTSADNTRIDPARREELVNSYDNALRYNLEIFFRSLNLASWRDNVFVIYTSDHGQTLSEHGERHTHCGTARTTASTEASVPLLLITKAPISVETKYLASHANIFPTLLDMMGFPDSERRYPYALSLLHAKASQSQIRYFSVGNPQRAAVNWRLMFDH